MYSRRALTSSISSQHKYDRGQHTVRNPPQPSYTTPLQTLQPSVTHWQSYPKGSSSNTGQHCIEVQGGRVESYIHRDGYTGLCYLGVRYFDNNGRVVRDDPHVTRVVSTPASTVRPIY